MLFRADAQSFAGLFSGNPASRHFYIQEAGQSTWKSTPIRHLSKGGDRVSRIACVRAIALLSPFSFAHSGPRLQGPFLMRVMSARAVTPRRAPLPAECELRDASQLSVMVSVA